MKEIQSEELKKVELNLLKKIDTICREHGWKYSLCGGTLLGAIRHMNELTEEFIRDFCLYLKNVIGLTQSTIWWCLLSAEDKGRQG